MSRGVRHARLISVDICQDRGWKVDTKIASEKWSSVMTIVRIVPPFVVCRSAEKGRGHTQLKSFPSDVRLASE